METYETPISNRLIDWLIYGNRENEKTPLQKTLENTEERIKRFNSILAMK